MWYTLNFPLTAGKEKVFNIDNSRPGGGTRTIGYWKNWNSYSHDGAFVDRAAKTGNHLLDEFLSTIAIGNFGAGRPAGALNLATAVHILSKEDTSGKGHANDAVYALAAQLLAAKANVAAGAAVSPTAANAIADADKLLYNGGTLSDGITIISSDDAAHFSDTGDLWKGGKTATAMRTLALQLANILDQYNNGTL